MKKNTVARIRSVSLLSVCLGSVLFLTSCSDGDSQGLVAHWKFEEGKGDQLLDTSGHGNHGTIHGAKWTKGRDGGGLRFDGVDDYVNVPVSASLNSATEEVTLMCWVKTPLTGRHTILERWPYEDSTQRCLEVSVDSERRLVYFALSSTGGSGAWHKSSGTIHADKWVHLAATSDGENMRIYINGRQDPSICSSPSPRKIHPSTADLHIGAWYSGLKWEYFFKGIIDEVKVYSRALTHKEILEHYRYGSPKGTVTGKVVDVRGKPIRAARVNVGLFQTTTDRQGRYRITVPAGLYDVETAGKGYRIGIKPDIKVKEGQTAKADIALVEDKTPPVVLGLKTEGVDGVNATVVWKTNEACSSRVKYGTSSQKYDKTLESPSRVKTHRLTLTGLASGTKYYFAVESTDEAQNATASKERIFSTVKVDHPRLIFRKSDIPTLRKRSAKTPWKEMKANAIASINRLTYKYDPSKQGDNYIRRRYESMAGIARTGALAYILDPANKTSYKNKMVDALSDWGRLFVDARDWTGNNGQYWLRYDWCSAYAHSVLALDIIYNDLIPSERIDLESKLNAVADWHYNKRNDNWGYHHGLYGLWALYQNGRSRIDSSKVGWKQSMDSYMTPGGVYHSGPSYGSAAFDRVLELPFCLILSQMGEGDYCNDPNLVGFVEWVCGASVNPSRYYTPFGNSLLDRTSGTGIGHYAASRFSAKAGGNAAWMINGRIPSENSLLQYVLVDWPLPAPKKPLSDIWDGFAAFWEDNPSDRSLMGEILNFPETTQTHKEVNSIYLSAYGEHVLRNVGYIWFDEEFGGSPGRGGGWTPAESGNTVLIDGQDHVSNIGAGITEGFTAPRFDYACGYSKDALPNGKHWRNFVFVHPRDGRCGYWVLFDEVDADKASSKVNVALHPNADNSTTISEKLEYRAKIGPNTHSGHDVYLSIFLGTKPTSTSIKDGILDGAPNDLFTGKYVYSTYSTDGQGRRNIVTVLFPHDAKHAKAKMTRITGKDYTGAKVNLGGSVTDVAIESSGKKAVKCDGVSFRGLAVLYRLEDKANAFYFVRKGRSFDNGARPRRGFESDADVSVYVKGKQGRIISTGAKVTLYYPGITGVTLNGKAGRVLDSGNGWVRIAVTKGTFNLGLKAGKN